MRRGVGLRAVAVVVLLAGACSDDTSSSSDDDGGGGSAPSTPLVADFTYEADHLELGPTNCPFKSVH